MSTITIQSEVLPGWSDTRTSGLELWIFSDQDWVDVAGVLHGAGNRENRYWTQRVTGLTNNTTTRELTIPAFSLTSTRDAIRGNTVRLFFWIAVVNGSSVTFIDSVPGTENGLQVPSTVASISSCSPVGTCAVLADLILFSTPSPSFPIDSYYNKDEVNRLIAGVGSGLAPANGTYISQTPISGVANGQAMSALATGLVKNTTSTGVQSIASAGTDYQTPLTAGVDYLAPNGSGAGLTALNASALASGTVPDARFPSTLPALNGSALTSLNASQLGSGTIPDARFPATLPALNGSALTALNASNLASGTVPDARFPATLPALSGANLTALNASNLASGTVPLGRLSGITNIEISAAAAIAYSKLNLTGAIVDGDLAGGITVAKGGTGVATFTSNGVLYGNGASALQVTSQGAANSVLTANAGAPSFSATPTIDRITANPASVSYDFVSGSFAVGFSFGNSTPASPGTINVTTGKQLSTFMSTAINSGAGKMFAYEFSLQATGGTQDSEVIRGLLGRVTNSGTGNGKTSAVRVGATGSGSNASQLIGVDADITVVAGTNNLSSVYAATLFGTTDDKATGYLIASSDGGRFLLGWGSFGPTKFASAAYRAWMGTGSDANARGFQQLNNAGTETFFTDLSGNITAPSLTLSTTALAVTSGGLGLTSATQGDILYASASNVYSKLAKDTNATRYLSNTGTSNNPAWAQVNLATGVTGTLPQTAVGNLGMVMISTVAASNQATVDFTGLDDTYDAYTLVISSAKPATDDVEAWIRVGTGGTPTYQTSGYRWSFNGAIAGTTQVGGSVSDSKIAMTQVPGATVAVGNATGENWSGRVEFNNPEASDFMELSYRGQYSRAVGDSIHVDGGGRYDTAGAITAIRFMFSSGNVSTGRFTLYGLRKS